MAALHRLDHHVGQLIDATKQAGTFADTNFVILGDHYQINVDHMIHLNTLFAQKGWLTPRQDQTFEDDWSVMAKTADGSTYIYTRHFDDLAELKDLIAGVEGVETVITGDEAAKRGADPACALMVEAKEGYYFTDESRRPLVVEPVHPATLGQPDRYHGVHGYDPAKPDYQTTLLFNGPAVKAGARIEAANLVDEAPTFARLLGLQFDGPMPGQCLDGIFKEDRE